MDLSSVRKIYFIGIGGIAMSAAAGLAKQLGYAVAGSDSKELYDPTKSVLETKQIPYHLGYNEDNAAAAKADLFIASAGEDLTNPEIKYLADRNIPVYSFSELLALLSKDKLRVVVAGTHGKSTTAALLGQMLQNLDDSSFMTGGVLRSQGSNFHNGSGHYFVFEGDEYKALYNDQTPKFHYYKADILILTNLEFDHPDLFSDFNQLKQEFQHLIENMPEDGLIVYNADDVNLTQLVYPTNVASVGFSIEEPSAFQAREIKFLPQTTFEVKFLKASGEEVLENYSTELPGQINVYNALAVLSTLRTLGFTHDNIAPLLLNYTGLKRRFEIIGEKNGITVIDDYAHHPTAVRETLLAARSKYPRACIWAVFEPHTFSRTRVMLSEFARSFDNADKLIIANVYSAREKALAENVTTNDLIQAVQEHNSKFRIHNSIWKAENRESALKILVNEIKFGDVVIVMAVGSFNTLAEQLMKKL